jgi:hypothetical protein
LAQNARPPGQARDSKSRSNARGRRIGIRVVEWIRGGRDSVIVGDRDCCHVRLTQGRCAALGATELHGERFVAFDVGIVINQNSKALSGFTGVKGQDAGNNV